MSDARAAALKILGKLEQKQNKEVWNANVSDWFKEKMTEEAFLANMTLIQAQLGGIGNNRKLIQENQADGDPRSGYQGTVYSFMFSTTFPVAKVYEMIILIREGGNYKILWSTICQTQTKRVV
ncbi:DUF4019 domain-containing protein [Paraburkholderia youngii]|uniref:DUF4019 domain-containing protein n=1 Tax=Paraburkholderia youngii TaxID=2782701 RepID=UPI003D1A1B1A